MPKVDVEGESSKKKGRKRKETKKKEKYIKPLTCLWYL
jgi:hypothetical protein